MKKQYWRFKTIAEHKEAGTFEMGWNEEGMMDYLYGTYIPEDLEIFAEKNQEFTLTNTGSEISKRFHDTWTIIPEIHLTKEEAKTMASEDKSTKAVTPKTEGVPTFDIDRLAKEIDGIFQVQLTENGTKLKKVSDDVLSQSLKSLQGNTEEKIEKYREEVEKIFPDMKERLMEEFHKGRTVFVLPDKSEIKVEHMDHPVLEEVVTSLHYQRKAMLVGPAGTGKTTMIGHIAERLKLPFYKYSCSRDSSVHDLLGYKQPKSETYLETSFLNAYENGGIFLVDEYDAMSGDMALFFNGVADNSKFISIPHRDSKPQAIKHKDFYLVMCGNTWGKGSTDYSGRDFQDLALMDRFRFCRHFVGYHTELEKEFMGDHYDYAVQLRKVLEDVGSYLSTRNIEDIATLIACDTSFKSITQRVAQDLTEDEQERVIAKVGKYISKSESAKSGKDKTIYYQGKHIPLSEIMNSFPPGDTAKIKKLKQAQPKLYEEYKYAIASLGYNI